MKETSYIARGVICMGSSRGPQPHEIHVHKLYLFASSLAAYNNLTGEGSVLHAPYHISRDQNTSTS